VFADKPSQGSYGGEPLVASGGAASPGGLDVGKKLADEFGRHIDDCELLDRAIPYLADEGNQEGNGVTITVLGIAGEIAFGDDVFQQEPSNPRAEQPVVAHGCDSMA
jgi:hypothetical protein